MGLYISASGLLNAIRRNDITANNIANLRSAGYQAARAQSAESPGGGAYLDEAARNSAPGPIETTGNSLDIASNTGFFRVTLPDGTTGYTRDGHFGLNAQGEIVTANGARLDPPITAPTNATSVTVLRDGTVTASTPGGLPPTSIGFIQVVQFTNPGGLEAIGNNLYRATPASGDAQTATGPVQYYPDALQSSNVDLATEQVNSVLNVRTAQANIGAFRAQHDILGELLNLRG